MEQIISSMTLRIRYCRQLSHSAPCTDGSDPHTNRAGAGGGAIVTAGVFFSLENPAEVFKQKLLIDAMSGKEYATLSNVLHAADYFMHKSKSEMNKQHSVFAYSTFERMILPDVIVKQQVYIVNRGVIHQPT